MRAVVLIAALAAPAVASAQAPNPANVDRGQAVFTKWCAPCHQAGVGSGGRAFPGTASLELKYKGTKPAALEQRTDLPGPVLKVFLRSGSLAMPAFRKVEIPDSDIDAIAAYLAAAAAKTSR
jgi:mono/diheme cytochrome c family protein